MAKVSKAIVDKDLRDRVFADAIFDDNDEIVWNKINDRQYGCILTDANGVERYIRLGAIVAEIREDMSAQELMESEIEAYNAKIAEKEEKAKAKAEKIAKDKERRAKEKAEKEKESEI